MFHEKLKELRANAKKTQKDLADYLMISPQSVSKWELGEFLPSMEYLPKIAKFLDCEPNDFFERKEYQKEIPSEDKDRADQMRARICCLQEEILFLIEKEADNDKDKEFIDRVIAEKKVLLRVCRQDYKALCEKCGGLPEGN